MGGPNRCCWLRDGALAAHLPSLALTKFSYAGGVLVGEKAAEPEDMLAFVLILRLRTQKGVLAKSASYRFLEQLLPETPALTL